MRSACVGGVKSVHQVGVYIAWGSKLLDDDYFCQYLPLPGFSRGLSAGRYSKTMTDEENSFLKASLYITSSLFIRDRVRRTQEGARVIDSMLAELNS
jgi:hypothetical protein